MVQEDARPGLVAGARSFFPNVWMLRQLTVEKHFSAETLARRLEVSVDTVHKWAKDRKIRGRIFGKRCVRYPASSVNRFLKSVEI
jgi:excisionase family DNA binding protein